MCCNSPNGEKYNNWNNKYYICVVYKREQRIRRQSEQNIESETIQFRKRKKKQISHEKIIKFLDLIYKLLLCMYQNQWNKSNNKHNEMLDTFSILLFLTWEIEKTYNAATQWQQQQWKEKNRKVMKSKGKSKKALLLPTCFFCLFSFLAL